MSLAVAYVLHVPAPSEGAAYILLVAYVRLVPAPLERAACVVAPDSATDAHPAPRQPLNTPTNGGGNTLHRPWLAQGYVSHAGVFGFHFI